MTTDRLGLNNSKLVKEIELNSKKFLGLRDIIEFKDDILYFWNDNTSEILTLTLREKIDQNTPYMTFSLIDIPNFDITSLSINKSGTRIALSGPKGLAVVEIPKFKTSQCRILCKSQTLDERSFINCEIKQVSWHPGSLTDSHVLVLTSDNNIRVYDSILDGRQSHLEVWPLGRVPSRALSVTASITHSLSLPMPLLAGLGDTTVSFDFLPRIQGPGNSWIEWPLIILRGNGDVYLLIASIKTFSAKPKVVGPLSMYPEAADNYGSDFASILVLGDSLPSIVVLASTTGTLYHCTLLVGDEDEEEIQNEDIYQNTEMIPLHSLYVLETLELDVSLISWETDKIVDASEILAGCGPTPIKLYREQESRYLIMHSAGVHAVCIGRTITSLRHIASLDIEKEDENKLSSLWCDEASRCEFLLCTSLLGLPQVHHEETNLTTIQGLIVTDSPKYLVALLANTSREKHEIVSIPLGSIMFQTNNLPLAKKLKEKNEEGNDSTGPYISLLKEPFDIHIKKLLWRNVSQPFIKLLPEEKNSKILSKESLDMLAGALKVLREEYIKRHFIVQQEFEKRIRILTLLKSTHLSSLANLEEEKDQLHAKAEQIAELYESLKEKQIELCKRSENILRLINNKRPTISLADQQMKQPLNEVNQKMPKFVKSMAQIKNKLEFHQNMILQQNQKNKKKLQEVNNQSILIRETIKQINSNLSSLKYQINNCKSHLGI